MNDTLDWDLLRVFLAVAQTGSLTQAAARLGSSQPTTGRQLRALEEQLGAALVRRHSRGIALTERGEALLETALAMDGHMQALTRRLQATQDAPEGVVRISATEVVGVHIMMPALGRLRAAYPRIALELTLSTEAADLLQGDADIAVRMFRPTQDELIARKVGSVEVGFYASDAYLARRGVPKTLDALVAPPHDHIGPDHAPAFYRWSCALHPALTRDRVGFRTNSLLAQLAAVRAGAGVGLLQIGVARRYPELVRLLPDQTLMRLEIWLVTHRDVRHGAHIRAVFDALARDLSAYSDALTHDDPV